jgi:hypothetical protein
MFLDLLIRIIFGMDWINVAEDRDWWLVVDCKLGLH